MARRTTVAEAAKVIGVKVREHRRKAGLSQEALAKKAGTGRAALTRLELGEAGERGMSLGKLIHVANALGVDVVDLLPSSSRLS